MALLLLTTHSIYQFSAMRSTSTRLSHSYMDFTIIIYMNLEE